jgi:PAS domain S-box-containing protein
MTRRDEDWQAVLLDQIDASVIVSDMAGNVISWNGGAEALYGWSAAEAVGRNARDLIVPEDTREAQRLVVEVSRDGRWDGEMLVHRKDGSTFTAYIRNRLIRDERGAPSAIVGVAVDISARVAVETELLQSRNYAQAVTECMGEGLFTIDHASRVTYVNPAAEQMLGWPAGELLGRIVHEIRRPNHSEAPFPGTPIERVLTERTTVRVEDDLFTMRGGSEIPVAYTAAPFRTEDRLEGCVVIFQDATERRRRERESRQQAATLECINRVQAAIVEDRLVLHAQPIVDLRSGQTVQHELLLRMREADGRIAPPAEFLPVAERYALVGEIDRWVVKQACSLAGAGCPVQLNVSARSVGNLDVLEHIERSIDEHAVAPGLLVFEITETAIVEEEEGAHTFAERLRAHGCQIALDDFGTGYGTLTYLKWMPLDFLKLDIEFVRDLVSNSASRHVVKAVLALARDFHLQTIAEGVEDATTLELLRELGVDFAQGYLLGRPAPFATQPGERTVQARGTTKARSRARPAGHRARATARQTEPPKAPVRSGAS